MQLSLPTCEATPEHPLQLIPTLEQESLQLQNLLDSGLGEFVVNFYWLCASNNVLYSFSKTTRVVLMFATLLSFWITQYTPYLFTLWSPNTCYLYKMKLQLERAMQG